MSDAVMISWLLNKIKALGPTFVVQFADSSRDELNRYSSSLGRMVRSEFKMWEDHWTAHFADGVDMSPDHPDQRSQRVIEQTWEQLQ